MHPPLTRTPASRPPLRRRPRSPPPRKRARPRPSLRPPPLRGGTGSPRGLRLLRASAGGASALPGARREGPRPPPLRRRAIRTPARCAASTRSSPAASGPAGRCSSGSWPTPSGAGRARLLRLREPSARAEGRARLRLRRLRRTPLRAATRAAYRRAQLVRARGGSGRLREFRRRNRSETRARSAAVCAETRRRRLRLDALEGRQTSRSRETFPSSPQPGSSPRRAGTRRTSCWTTRTRTRGVWGAIRSGATRSTGGIWCERLASRVCFA